MSLEQLQAREVDRQAREVAAVNTARAKREAQKQAEQQRCNALALELGYTVNDMSAHPMARGQIVYTYQRGLRHVWSHPRGWTVANCVPDGKPYQHQFFEKHQLEQALKAGEL